MGVETLTDMIDSRLNGIEDDYGKPIKKFAFVDLGDIFFRTNDGHFFKMTVEEIKQDECEFVEEDDWG